MAPTPQEFAAVLRTAAERVEAHGMENPERLAPVVDILTDAARSAPSPEIGRWVRRCAEAVRALAAGEAGEPIAVATAAEECLAAALDAAENAPGAALRMREAETLLENAMAMGILRDTAPAHPVNTMDPTDPADPIAALNDAAARLFQVEPDSPEELHRILARLSAAANAPPCRADCEEALAPAIRSVEAALSGKAAPDGAWVEGIGEAIETALRLLENGGPGNDPKRDQGNRDLPGRPPAPPEADEADFMPRDADMDLVAAFIAESGDLIAGAEDALLALEADTEDPEAVSTVFRAFHNIKGTSAFFELEPMTELAHHAESILSQVRDGQIRYAGGYPDLALRSVDMLKELFRRLESALGGEPFRKPPGYDDLIRHLADPAGAGIDDAESEPSASHPSSNRKPAAPHSDAECPPIEIPVCEPDPDEEETEPRPRRSPMAGRPPSVESSIRVPIRRLDRFIDMVGELVVAHSMVAQDPMLTSGENHDLVKKVAQTGKIVRELQSMSMSMRMIPLKAAFRKMARLVRDLSRKVGKDVRFETEGEETEIDRNMVDIVNDPLVHMVRNAIDHGIEPPEERERIGKPRQGTVRLSAFHAAGNVVVEIRDDGRGLDRDRILAKAAERGLVPEGATLGDREAYNLIFEPGFSTAKIVSDVSGRGVGMDVVKRNIEGIRGHVEIDAEPGRGSVFRMSLPLTLAIIDGMVVRVGIEKYVIPTISIVRSVQPDPARVTSVMRKGRMLDLQGRLIPLFRLAELFGAAGADAETARAIAVVVENDGFQAGLLVDELIGSQQIVIKTMGESLGNIPGISGSAIMPDGRVGLILDVGGLVRLAHRD
jgi:two-component system, chemotaxis family, sensor kinase CheA